MEVIWHSHRIRVDVPLATLTLGSLKALLVARTGLPAEAMELFHHGARMSDSEAALSSYALPAARPASTPATPAVARDRFWHSRLARPGPSHGPAMTVHLRGGEVAEVAGRAPACSSKSLCLCLSGSISRPGSTCSTCSASSASSASGPLSAPAPAPVSPSASASASTSAAAHIHLVATIALRDTTARVEALERRPPPGSSPLPPPQSMAPADEAARLSERLLQSLITLDGLQIHADWSEARSARKDSVRALQALLDRLDHIRSHATPTQN